eukprot:Hpha_TRINITY_DN15513_c3_g2::TRINITY_DN15513_c3_g2_i3::g.107558::m.107558
MLRVVSHILRSQSCRLFTTSAAGVLNSLIVDGRVAHRRGVLRSTPALAHFRKSFTAVTRVKELESTDGQTPCTRAASKGNVEELKLLIDRGADVNEADERGRTPCFAAAARNRNEALILLIDHGADINKSAVDGRTPCFAAAARGSTSTLRLLIENGADINKPDLVGRTPCIAAAGCSTAVLRLLLHHGADVNKADVNGRTPYRVAAQQRRRGALELLFNQGAHDAVHYSSHG